MYQYILLVEILIMLIYVSHTSLYRQSCQLYSSLIRISLSCHRLNTCTSPYHFLQLLKSLSCQIGTEVFGHNAISEWLVRFYKINCTQIVPSLSDIGSRGQECFQSRRLDIPRHREILKCEVMANFMRNATAVSVTLAPVINKKQLCCLYCSLVTFKDIQLKHQLS